MKFRPLHDRVLIKRVPSPDKTSGGLYIPDRAKEVPTIAEVLAVGSGKTLANGQTVAPNVKVGDLVLVGKYAGTEVELDGEKFTLVREEEFQGIVEDYAVASQQTS